MIKKWCTIKFIFDGEERTLDMKSVMPFQKGEVFTYKGGDDIPAGEYLVSDKTQEYEILEDGEHKIVIGYVFEKQ